MAEQIQERLAEIQARVSATSVGPWELDARAQRGTVYCGDSLGSAVATCHHQYTPASLEQEDRNAEFIAHARQDVPWLLELVRELLQDRTHLEANARRYEFIRRMVLRQPMRKPTAFNSAARYGVMWETPHVIDAATFDRMLDELEKIDDGRATTLDVPRAAVECDAAAGGMAVTAGDEEGR